MKKAIPLLLALVLALSLAPAVFAASGEAEDAAWALHELGLLEGSGTRGDGTPDFALDRALTRGEAVTLLVRLLGKETEALSVDWPTPFTDVPDWAKPYVGYAYVNGLTYGVGEHAFGADRPAAATEYISFLLRALGYGGADFRWDAAWELSDRIGLTDGRYGGSSAVFTRGDAVLLSDRALDLPCKGGSATLLDALGKTRRVFDPEHVTEADLRGVWAKCIDPADGENCIRFSGEFMTGAYSLKTDGGSELGLSVYSFALSDGELTRHLLRRQTAALDEAGALADSFSYVFDNSKNAVLQVLRLRMPDKDTLCYSIGVKSAASASVWEWSEEMTFKRVEGSDLFDRVEARLAG